MAFGPDLLVLVIAWTTPGVRIPAHELNPDSPEFGHSSLSDRWVLRSCLRIDLLRLSIHRSTHR
jgi:hypothetical protein